MKLFPVILKDHLGGFEKQLYNVHLYKFDAYAKKLDMIGDVVVTSFLDERVRKKYSNLNIKYSAPEWLWDSLVGYNTHPELKLKNFICSFIGSDHISKQLLSAILNNQGYFNPVYSSKNFTYGNDWITSHLDSLDLTDIEVKIYCKFFINNNIFNDSVYSFGPHIDAGKTTTEYQHSKNIYNLEHKLTQSFLHVVAETIGTSYYPFVTEKFLYSVVTRGLFLAYGQPGWHAYLNTYYGFRLYDTIFDYAFDSIQNPVKRLIRLIETVSKFAKLSCDDWRDLYHIEQDNIDYNYQHYFSGNYKKHLAQFA